MRRFLTALAIAIVADAGIALALAVLVARRWDHTGHWAKDMEI